MFISGNFRGFAMFIIAGVMIAFGSLVLKMPDSPVMIAAGAMLIAIDLGLRLLRRKEDQARGWAWRKETGGYLFFIPVWAFGVALVALNVVNLFVSKK